MFGNSKDSFSQYGKKANMDKNNDKIEKWERFAFLY